MSDTNPKNTVYEFYGGPIDGVYINDTYFSSLLSVPDKLLFPINDELSCSQFYVYEFDSDKSMYVYTKITVIE